jgi:hypothetical protein
MSSSKIFIVEPNIEGAALAVQLTTQPLAMFSKFFERGAIF